MKTHQTYFLGDNLHKMSKPVFFFFFVFVFLKNKKSISKCCLLELLPNMLNIKLTALH